MNIRHLHMYGFMSHVATDLEFPETGAVTVRGANGCLHKDTPIHDPVDGTTKTVGQRCALAKPFHVWAMGPDGPVVTAALPPTRFQAVQMARITTANGCSIVTTLAHRFWTGVDWATSSACYERLQAVPTLLATSSGSALLARAVDGLRWSEISPGSLVDCRPVSRSCGGPPLSDQDDAQASFPSQGDAPERSRSCLRPGDQSSAAEYSQSCQQSDRPSKSRCANQAHPDHVTHLRLSESRPLHGGPLIPIQARSLLATHHLDTTRSPALSVPVSTEPLAPPGVGYDCKHTYQTGSDDATIVISVELLDVEPYYDFHVPVYLNYWACGLWHHNSGKSSIAEAVSWGLWGRTLRGTDPTTPERACTVTIETDRVAVTRSRTGRKTTLTWSQHGADPVPWENNTKAQQALEALIGSHDTWRRTAVFSSSDASRFTGATDGERKRFLEGLLGLDRFDRGLATARNDLRAAEQSKALLARDVAAAEQRMAFYTQSAREHREALKNAPAPPTGAQAHVDALTAALRAQGACLGEIDEDISGLVELRATDAAELRALDAAAQRLQVAACPTCAQPISEDLRNRFVRRATKQRSMIALTAGQMRTRIATANTSRDAIRSEAEQMRQRRADIISDRNVYDAWRDRIAAMQQRAEAAAGSATDAATEVAALTTAIAEGTQRGLDLKAVEQVLGLKGVRAQLTASTLTAISHTANAWLSRIAGPGLSLALRPYSERKRGGVSDAIGLEIDGAGGGHGYKAASGGERRRIDLALLFALAEVAAAASGGGHGTIFADEVFDALDADGMAAATQVLEELSADRAVVVITHAGVPVRAVANWTVEAGEVTT